MQTILSGRFSHERLLHFGLWSAQLSLASFFAIVAFLKLTLHHESLMEVMAWSASVPSAFVRWLGVVEMLGAMIIAVPAVTKPAQRVVGWAALGFTALMVVAAIMHVVRGEFRVLPVDFAVGCVAAFVAWGRLAHAPLNVDESL